MDCIYSMDKIWKFIQGESRMCSFWENAFKEFFKKQEQKRNKGAANKG
ncbi:hypothetical protein IGI01_14530 [Bacillus thuringiensis]|nr:hypothetical protein [Bacillus thuringiensis]